MSLQLIAGVEADQTMNRISSGNTFGMKRFLPTIFFATCAVMLLVGAVARPFDFALVVAPLIAAVLGALVLAATVSDLADEVFDDGDSLLVRKGDVTQRVMLADVVEVRLSKMSNPTRLTLKLRRADKFDGAVVFIPAREAWSLNSQRNLADELEARIGRVKKYAGKKGGAVVGQGREPAVGGDE
ncbi:hypothetical protein [Pseudomonas sp. CGJS7]|uniref:hypothetical protein n=1 Tax=Pseudomonas sp. CGJS7 TaxID=3109348 RepID=UPI003008F97C